MKKFLFIIFILVFASSAPASVYKWVDEQGIANFADDYSKVPSDYYNKVEEVSTAKMRSPIPSQTSTEYVKVGAPSGKAETQSPPIAQPLIREGDFAIKLVEALNIGKAESEAEAESMLASAGIAPQNGWIADYPVTPDVIGELENAIGEAADAGRLPMGKDEALKAFRTTAVELELPIIAEVPDRYAESASPTTPQYSEPSVINNYYYTEGPPVVTYYSPPPDYYYLYAWIPSPFWCSGFYFPGFYILHDFHRVISINRHACVITNHIRDHRTGKIFTIHPERRHEGRTFGVEGTPHSPPHTRGYNSTEARNGARSIVEHSRERVALGNTATPIKNRGQNNSNPAYSRSGQSTKKQVYNRESKPSSFNNGRNSNYGRPPVVDRRMDRTPHESGSHGMSDRISRRPGSVNGQNGIIFQRPSAGKSRSFSPPARLSERSSSPPPQAGGKLFSSSPMGSRGFSRPPQGDRGRSLGLGGPRF